PGRSTRAPVHIDREPQTNAQSIGRPLPVLPGPAFVPRAPGRSADAPGLRRAVQAFVIIHPIRHGFFGAPRAYLPTVIARRLPVPCGNAPRSANWRTTAHLAPRPA